jgi:D-beta-D-heptose 7-phosphate kinase/D-beta-D-heptose 1-phosphate adenosyltransferase
MHGDLGLLSMKTTAPSLSRQRVRQWLQRASQARLLVVGDLMLDQFVWGHVHRISPEAPVPVLEFVRESFMPGGAANVARNLTALGARATVVGVVGNDAAGRQLKDLLTAEKVDTSGLLTLYDRHTSIKTRIIAHQQQVVRLDRETRGDLSASATRRLLDTLRQRLDQVDAIIVGDYGKGVVTQPLLDELKRLCRERGLWLSLDPKPVHRLDLSRLSLITPNRKETFELAGMSDGARGLPPMQDAPLLQAAQELLQRLQPALLLVTLGEQGMLLCRRDQPPLHIPTVAREVFDVSGAGDTVIASFTLAIALGASPVEAAIFSNHAAGVVVGKVGTAAVTPEELLASFAPPRA